ncbi:MAG: hypothetical protein HY800_04320 [Ignavibacteriales bacterium]|nr:hypothetical protein [Ignavibacteriales bacterium]
MKWRIDLSHRSVKFIRQNNIPEDFVINKIELTLKKFQGEDVNIDVKRLRGEWKGFYRIRAGKLRIIVEFDFDIKKAFIEAIDWRGEVYK